jgi:translocation and assembly module TamB
MAEDPTSTPPAAGPPVMPRRLLAAGLGLLQPLWLVLGFAIVVLVLLAGTVHWLLTSEAGSRWLLARMPAVDATGFSGALLGDHWHADRVRITWAAGQASLTLEDLRADGLTWHWRPNPQAWLGVDVQQFAVRRVTMVSGPPGERPLPVPLSIAWPVQVVVAAARVDEVRVDELAPMHGLELQQLVLDAQPGAEHRVAQARVDWQGTTISASARIGNLAPLPLAVDATVAPTGAGDAPHWAAVVRAHGEAALFDVEATLRGVPRGGHAAPALDIQARLQLLQAWPLAGLRLQTTALDLAALSPQAPETRLSGSADLASSARNAPLQATIDIENTLPGRWNERRLPVRRVTLEASGSLAQSERLEIPRFDVALADATGAAGRWSGSAVWLGRQLTLDTRLAAVTPQRLDSRAAAMTLTGSVSATVQGLPSPDFSAPAASSPPARRTRIDWKLDLEGRLDGAPKPVRLVVEGSADAQRVELRRARAEAGAASAELQATLQRAGRGEWQLQTAGRLQDFDPVPWWPGEAGSAWRKGPHRLSGNWDLALRLPGDAGNVPLPALAQRVAGNGTLQIKDSLLAGVPLAATATLAYAPAAAPEAGSLHAELLLGGNRFSVDGRGDPAGSGRGDRWRADIAAEAVASLAPLVRLWPALTDFVPTRGSVSAKLSADGRWPELSSEGSASVKQLLAGRLGLARGEATWRMDLGGTQPLALQVELAGVKFDRLEARQLRADLSGTLADHRIDISGALPMAPPLLAEKVLGITVQSGTRAQLLAQGAWQPDPGGGGRWLARIERLQAFSWDGSDNQSQPASAWLQASELRAEVTLAADGSFAALRADSGRLRLADALALRWDEVRLDLRGPQPQIEVHADIESFAVAPLLARLQPALGWDGDLKVAARVDIRAAERFDADIVVERREGDLHISDSSGTQLLGLTELRLALSAHDGLWTVTPSLKGRSLGEIAGQLQARTTPDRRWPHADAPITGSVVAHVAKLGIWSAWIPPGWRLAGEMRSIATLSGTFGDPRYSGEISGSDLGVRNLLEGVNVTDGQVLVRLEGETAQIERFTLRGGDGTLTLSGGATLGSSPQARVQVVADRFRVLGRVDRLVIASGQAELSLQAEQTRLDGRFTIDEGLFDISRADAPSLDNDVTVRRNGVDEVDAADAPQPQPARNFALGVDIDLGQKLQLRGRGLDTLLRGVLRLSTPGGRLAIHGTISTESGTYAAYGQRLDIERGIVAFSGAPDNLRLDVLALRPNIDLRVGVAITGTLLLPRVRLYSEPEMSDNEKLSWLLLGREPDGLDRADTALLQRAAVALLAGEGEGPTDALLRNLGIDEISLRQGGDGDTRETVVALGKQLSRRWYVGYERGVNATTGTWQLIYRIAQRFTLRAQSGEDNSLDVIWVWRLQETPADAGMRKSVVVPP